MLMWKYIPGLWAVIWFVKYQFNSEMQNTNFTKKKNLVILPGSPDQHHQPSAILWEWHLQSQQLLTWRQEEADCPSVLTCPKEFLYYVYSAETENVSDAQWWSKPKEVWSLKGVQKNVKERKYHN